VSSQLHTPAGKEPLVPTGWLDGFQSRSGCRGEEKNSQPLPGLELPIIQPVAQRYTAELSRPINKLIYVILIRPLSDKTLRALPCT
jgi:hypothetical protein